MARKTYPELIKDDTEHRLSALIGWLNKSGFEKEAVDLYKISAAPDAREFMLYDLDESEIDLLYSIFKESYEKSTGESWAKETFLNRGRNWTFFGHHESGVVALRKQRSGMWKLTAVAGSPRGVVSAIGLMKQQIGSEPIWGAISADLVSIAERYGLIAPHNKRGFGWIMKLILNKIPSSVFGGRDLQINSDGSMSIDVVEVGPVSKYFVANKPYFEELFSRGIGAQIKEEHPLATTAIEKFLSTIL